MSYRPASASGAVAAALLGVPVALAWVWSLGSVVVHDPDEVVAAVTLQDSEMSLVAAALPFDLYATTAKLEGEAVIRCRAGREIRLGYVTTAMHLRRTVRAAECAARPS